MLLSTYHDLFCLICHKYDCLTHLNGKPLSSQFKHRVKWSDILTKPNPEACSNNCCMKLKNAGSFFENLEIIRKRMKSIEFDGMNYAIELQEFLSKTIEPGVKISRDGVDKENIPVLDVSDTITNSFVFSKTDLEHVMENWSESSISQFRNLKRIYKNNICELSYLLNKSCEETLYFNILNQITELLTTPKKTFSKSENSNTATETQTKLGKKKSKGKAANKKQLDQMKKSMNNKRQKNKDNQRIAYRPCDTCTSENHVCCETCPCFSVGNYCENSCTCAKNCPNRFGGCNCKGKCESNQCPCYMANRECDPDLCGCEMNFSKLPNDNKVKICKNNQIQRGLKVQIVMAPSCIAGWGGYSSEVIMPGTLVSEYCGEILTRHASEVRGRIYDKGGCSFVFNLNNEYDVDAMRKGNKVHTVSYLRG